MRIGILITLLAVTPAFAAAPTSHPAGEQIIAIDPPEKGFFSKRLEYDGIPIKAPAVVVDEAMFEARKRLAMLMDKLPAVRAKLRSARAELHIIGRDQSTSDLPEWQHMKGKPFEGKLTIDQRTRGMGGRMVSCGEENLLRLEKDRYRGRDICIHEFAHCILEYGAGESVRKKFHEQRDRSLAAGLWVGSYAGSNDHEFFAELTMWYFGTHGDMGMKGTKPKDGREGLKEYDPQAFALMDDFYGGRMDAPRVGQGLSVRDGVLMRDGKPYRAIGANYFSLFTRLVKDPADVSSLDQLPQLSRGGVPFVRFACCGFWPVDWKLYLENREEYFRRLDLVVRKAEASNVGLIPSLFWYAATVSDIVGEPLDQMGNPASKTNEFIRRYTEEVIGRYKGSPAIWGWEFGNEYNLDCNLPNAPQHRPPVWPNLGTAAQRTERDELKWEQLRVAMLTFATTARRLDSRRIILTGHAIPRLSAWHNWKENKWTADTRDQFAEILLRDNPDPFDMVTVHVYHEAKGKYAGPAESLEGCIAAAAGESGKAGKPLFLGEFGAPRELGAEKERAVFAESVRATEKSRVPLAAFWVFDQPNMDKDWSATFKNERAWMLDMVKEANERMRERSQAP